MSTTASWGISKVSLMHSYLAGVENCACGRSGNVCDCNAVWKLDLLNELETREMWEMSHGIAGSFEPIIEHIPVSLNSSNRSYTKLKTKIDRMARQAWKWRDNVVQNNSIWLYEQFAGEPGLRRSYVHQINPIREPRRGSAYGAHQLQVVRHWCSESCEPVVIDVPRLKHWNRVFDPQYAVGTTDGRICEFELGVLDTGKLYNTVWIGIKEDIGCGLDEWEPLLPFHNLTGASTEEYQEFNRITLGQVVSNPEQYRGQYYLLARVAADNGVKVGLRGKVGWAWDEYMQPISHSSVFFEGKGLGLRDLVSLGVVQLPIDDMRYCTTVNNNSEMDSVTLSVDFHSDTPGAPVSISELYLIPYEHSAVLRRPDEFHANSDLNAGYSTRLYVHTHEDDTVQVSQIATAGIVLQGNEPFSVRGSAYDPSLNRFYLPEKGSRIAMAIQLIGTPSGSTLEDVTFHDRNLTWEGQLTVHPRWLSDRDA